MQTRTRRTLWVLSTAALIGFGILVWYRLSLARQTSQAPRPLPLVQVVKPLQLEMLRKLVLTADILPIQQADLMAKVAGYLEAIYVDRGDRVRSGQLLAVIRQPELEHQLHQAQANHDLAKVTFERLQELHARQLIAKQELDDSRTKFEVAKRTLGLQRTYLSYARIVAPFDMALKPGMFARVTPVLDRHPQALAVPSESLLVNELGSFVFAVGSTQEGAPTVRRVTVRTGIEDGGQVEILGGLGPSDQIVRTGKELVHDGSRVRIATDGAAES
jgi:multidrug efflux pump subunit AcrA (membrane-fusion protein)